MRRFDGLLVLLRRHAVRAWLGALLVAAVTAGAVVATARDAGPKPPVADYVGLAERIERGKVATLRWDVDTLTMTVTDRRARAGAAAPEPYEVAMPTVQGEEGFQTVLRAAREARLPVRAGSAGSTTTWLDVLGRVLPPLLVICALLYVVRHQLPSGKRFDVRPARSDVTFADVAGCGEAVEELRDLRAFLDDPARFAALGARPPKGVVLHGPPGTGKTLLAKAVASEAGVPFFEVAGASFAEMYVGIGSKRVRELFAKARAHAPSVVFIDEIDAVGGKRGRGGDGAGREADNTLTQLLREMDGFESSEHPVIVLAATNRLDSLDDALLRPGRFDRHVAVDAPDRRGRLQILEVHARGKALAGDVDLERVATETAGMTGAQLAGVLNEAALIAGRAGERAVTDAHLQDAFFRIVAGPEKQHRAMNERERAFVAFHEAGHAIVGERLSGSDKVHKISIVPRGQSAGQALYTSTEDAYLLDEVELRDRLARFLAGRAAEQVALGRVTSGAADDLKRATEVARRMVVELGMGESMGLVSAAAADGRPAARTAELVDAEVKAMLDDAYARAVRILGEEREALDAVAHALLAEEVIDRPRFLALAGSGPAAEAVAGPERPVRPSLRAA